MNLENLVLLNFIFLTALSFWMVRHTVVARYETQRRFEEVYQQMRNSEDGFNRRFEDADNQVWRDIDRLYEDMIKMKEDLGKKSTKGLNSRIPL